MIGKGLFRARDPQLGDCAYMDWGTLQNPEVFLTRDTYEANGYAPPFDQLPTREQYVASDA